MIIPELVRYYDRLLVDGKVPPLGLEDREVHYAIVIDADGKYVNTLSFKDDKDRGRTIRGPQSVVRSSGVYANLLCDNRKYVAGKEGREVECMEDFIRKIDELRESLDSPIPALDAISLFYKNAEDGILKFISDHVSEAVEDSQNITFMMADADSVIMEYPEVVSAVIARQDDDGQDVGRCSITGDKDVISRIHGKIKGICGCQTSGAVLVGFNAESFGSYGKSQGENAPVGRRAENAYVTAMNYLLKKDNGHKITYGESMTLVFWSENDDGTENILLKMAGYGGSDDVEDLMEMLKSPVKNGNPNRVEGKFYLLGLKPAASRIGISMFYDGDVSEMKEKMVKYFDDTDIIGARKSSILSLLSSTVKKKNGKSEDIQPNIISDMVMSIMTGTPYPRVVLNNAVHRCLKESHVTPSRASLIKSCLINSTSTNNKKWRPTVSLDRENANVGYLLGRLLATIENLQYFALGSGVNKTIKDELYRFMCTRPQAAFERAMDKGSYYLKKVRNGGTKSYYDKAVGEIVAMIDSVPVRMDADDRAMFAVGYYHQRQEFFASKNNNGGKSND